MRIRKEYLISFLVFSFLTSSMCAFAGQKQKLPRSYGSITLGMSVEAFKKLTHAELGRCVHCAEGELEADLFIDKDKAKLFNKNPLVISGATLNHQPPSLQPESISCFFYKDRLYSIVMNGVKDKLEAVKARYETAIGKPTGVDAWDTGVSQLRWENLSTMLRVAYTVKPSGVNTLEITYGDLKIMKQLPREGE